MRVKTLLLSSAIFGIALAFVLRFAHGAGAEPVARILTLGLLAIPPLALLVLPRVSATWHRLVAIAAFVLPACGLSGVVSLWLDPPEGAVWVAPWMGACLLVASLGAVRLFTDRGWSRAPTFLSGMACGYLPVGAAWLVMSRLGARPMGFDSVIVTLTAVHFHFAALAAPVYASRVVAALDGRARRVAAIGGVAVVVAIPVVAAGFMTTPVVSMVGVVTLAAGLLTVVALAAFRVRMRSRAARGLLWISAISVLLSMPLAVFYQWGQVMAVTTIDLEWMIRLHGFANAHGFATCGLLAWAIEDRYSASTENAPSAR